MATASPRRVARHFKVAFIAPPFVRAVLMQSLLPCRSSVPHEDAARRRTEGDSGHFFEKEGRRGRTAPEVPGEGTGKTATPAVVGTGGSPGPFLGQASRPSPRWQGSGLVG